MVVQDQAVSFVFAQRSRDPQDPFRDTHDLQIWLGADLLIFVIRNYFHDSQA